MLGAVFSGAVDKVLATLSHFGRLGIALALGAIALFLAYKWFRRRLFIRSLRMARITVDELRALMQSGAAPMILDVRPTEVQKREGIIPGAIQVSYGALDSLAISFASAADVVVYCACPNEASAVTVARQLVTKGARRVRPLLGGMNAWIAAGYELASSPLATGGSHDAQHGVGQAAIAARDPGRSV